MSIHNICFHGEIRKYQFFYVKKIALIGAMILLHYFGIFFFFIFHG